MSILRWELEGRAVRPPSVPPNTPPPQIPALSRPSSHHSFRLPYKFWIKLRGSCLLKYTGWHLSELCTLLRCNALSERHKIIKHAIGKKKKADLWKGFLHSEQEGTLKKCFVCEINPADVVLLCCCRLGSWEHNSKRGVPQSRTQQDGREHRTGAAAM